MLRIGRPNPRDRGHLWRASRYGWDIARTADSRRLEVTPPAKVASARAVWIAVLAEHPELIQRPILTASDGTTVIGHDPAALARVIAAG